MVHRAPDSRLLTNLIANEKEYARHLASLFPLSRSVLASLSAYAAASPADPTSPAQTIAAVIDVLAAADDALQRYNQAVETWRSQLASLKGLEDDLAAVLRDRDILVTRLIKASKSTKEAHRSSRLIAPLSGLNSASFSSLPSTNSTGVSGPASTNAKLAQAQAELQACEAHLVTKERELDARRISVARDGLGARCRALIDCGWVWSEMGKQGLKALQALGTSAAGHMASAPHYASDNSSLTPSQSASQTAACSAETSQEDPTSKERRRSIVEPKKLVAADKEDLTISLPPAHAISDVALPRARSQSPPAQKQDTSIDASPPFAPRQKRIKPGRRPPSQHITEASDEGSDEPNANPNPSVLRAPFPASLPDPGLDDTSSEEDPAAVGPFEIVENNPFEVIRRSMLGPSPSVVFLPAAPSPPNAHASAPDVRESPSKAPGNLTPGSAKRERRTSTAFFGSIRGLFRKPKERDRVATEWDEASPTKTNGKGGRGWVTRTDARLKKGGRTGDDSDDDPAITPRAEVPRTTQANVARRGSSRLRKGRPTPTRGIHGNGSSASIPIVSSSHARVDGWMTDSPAGAVPGAGKSRAQRGTIKIKRRKKSLANMRGSNEGHTDGEMDDHGAGGRWSLEPEVGLRRGMSLDVSVATSKPKIEVERERTLARLESSAENTVTASVIDIVPIAQPRRATTTTATSSRKPSTGGSPMHRRSASLSLVDTNMRSASPSSQESPTSTSMSWRKPPPQLDPSSNPDSPSQYQTPPQSPTQAQTEPRPKQHARRHIGNGHATHAKHAHNQSLMSIIADVTCQNGSESQDRNRVDVGGDRAKSLDILRPPGPAVRAAERRPSPERGAETAANGREHTRTATVGDTVHSEQAPMQRPIKSPLRSALRNASRTPSPSPAAVAAPLSVNGHEVKKESVAQTTAKPVQVQEDRGRASIIPESLRDSASISSYETTRESFYFDASLPPVILPPRSLSPNPNPSPPSRTRRPPLSFTFPPPPVDPPPEQVPQSSSNTTEQPPSSTTSTETPPVRRKSVRVSLQPTFSPTPPVLYDDEGGEYAPWSASFSDGERVGRPRDKRDRDRAKRDKPREDMWADSSEEDEEYSRARRLLSLVGESKGKGKARAKA